MTFEQFMKDKLGEVLFTLWQLDFQLKTQADELERLKRELSDKDTSA